MHDGMARLVPEVRRYAWGSREVLARFQGRAAPTEEPEAELWFGAHPMAPARLDGDGQRLSDFIAANPQSTLGADVAAAYDSRLPFLLKVLAIDQPLSLQAHPKTVDAQRGFAHEELLGIARNAPERVYSDAWPKPELLYALTDVYALCGFKQPADAVRWLEELAVPSLAPMLEAIKTNGADAYAAVVRQLLGWPQDARHQLVSEISQAAQAFAARSDEDAEAAHWLVALAARYPDDPGVAVAILMLFMRLEPGEALHLPAGELHAYLAGTGVEIMATSDNVLRGGLTPKHVDIEGLLEVLTTTADGPSRVCGHRIGDATVFAVDTPYFSLARFDVDGEVEATPASTGPAVLLTTDGDVTVCAADTKVSIPAGTGAFIPASTGQFSLVGNGQVFRATVGSL